MVDRFVPSPPAGSFNLAGWVDQNVDPGDRIVFPNAARYRTEHVRLYDLRDNQIVGRNSVLISTTPPPPPIAGVWKAPVDIVNSHNVEVTDLLVEGPRPAGSTFNVNYEGQHGFAIHGGAGITLCRCGSKGQYGDHVYISGAKNVTVCSHRSETQSGRNGVTTVDAEDVVIWGGSFNALRTMFNFEVHEGESVDRWSAEGVSGAWTTRAITGTGEGDANWISFKNISGAGTHKLSIEVYGTGSAGVRDYGARSNWTIDGFTNVRTPTTNAAYRMHYVNGLYLANLPPFPMSTTGSTLLSAPRPWPAVL